MPLIPIIVLRVKTDLTYKPLSSLQILYVPSNMRRGTKSKLKVGAAMVFVLLYRNK